MLTSSMPGWGLWTELGWRVPAMEKEHVSVQGYVGCGEDQRWETKKFSVSMDRAKVRLKAVWASYPKSISPAQFCLFIVTDWELVVRGIMGVLSTSCSVLCLPWLLFTVPFLGFSWSSCVSGPWQYLPINTLICSQAHSHSVCPGLFNMCAIQTRLLR